MSSVPTNPPLPRQRAKPAHETVRVDVRGFDLRIRGEVDPERVDPLTQGVIQRHVVEGGGSGPGAGMCRRSGDGVFLHLRHGEAVVAPAKKQREYSRRLALLLQHDCNCEVLDVHVEREEVEVGSTIFRKVQVVGAVRVRVGRHPDIDPFAMLGFGDIWQESLFLGPVFHLTKLAFSSRIFTIIGCDAR